MGNYVSSCTNLSFIPTMKTAKAARVIFPTGEIRHFSEPVKVAELMLEFPNFFVVNSTSLNIGRRFTPLSADEDLDFGNVYLMFPMRRVTSVVTAADVAVFFMAAGSATKRISGSKVAAAMAGEGGVEGGDDRMAEVDIGRPMLNLDEVETPEFKFRLAACRSKKPSLDTISEDQPAFSR